LKLKILAHGVKCKNEIKRETEETEVVAAVVIPHRRDHKAVETGYYSITDIGKQQKSLDFLPPSDT
jgi:hypothetical protein